MIALAFAADTAVFGLNALAAFSLPVALRRRRGQCPRCGYDLAGSTGRPCPECGARAA